MCCIWRKNSRTIHLAMSLVMFNAPASSDIFHFGAKDVTKPPFFLWTKVTGWLLICAFAFDAEFAWNRLVSLGLLSWCFVIVNILYYWNHHWKTLSKGAFTNIIGETFKLIHIAKNQDPVSWSFIDWGSGWVCGKKQKMRGKSKWELRMKEMGKWINIGYVLGTFSCHHNLIR